MTRIFTEAIGVKSPRIKRLFMNKFDISNIVENEFQRYGQFLSRHPWPFIIIPVITTIILSFGIFKITVNDDLRFLYTQPGSPSLYEFELHQKLDNLTDEPMTYVNIAIIASDGGNLLRKNFSDWILNVNSFILNNMTVQLKGQVLNFGQQFCNQYSYCNKSNQAMKLFLETYFSSKLRHNNQIKLTYPIMTVYGLKVFLPSNFYGVTMNENGTVDQILLISLVFIYRKLPVNYSNFVDETRVENGVETSVQSYLDSYLSNSGLKYSVYSMHKLTSEIAKNTWHTLIYLPMSLVLLFIFTVLTTCTTDAVTSKPIEGLFGVFTSLLAIASAAGLLFFFGVAYNSTVSVMPFLALALAVDDTYIILAAWHHTDKNQSVEHRLAITLKESGSAITVTALTDVFSFAIGAFSSTPAISAFCKFTAAAVAFDFIYQFTFFCGITALSGRREAQNRHCIFFWLPASKISMCRTRNSNNKNKLNPVEKLFKSVYSRLLEKRPFKICVMIFYFIFLAFSLYGCLIIKVNLTPSKILMQGSPLNHHISLAENYIWKQGVIGRIYVPNPPDFRIPNERERFLKFVDKLESTVYSMGSNSTLLWFREFQKYMYYFQHNDESFYEDLRKFTSLSANRNWGEQIHWTSSNSNDSMNSSVNDFYFTSGFHIANWVDRTKLVKTWRDICAQDQFKSFHAFVYDENNFFADQINSLAPNTIQDCGIAFFCMTLVCGLFITNKIILFWVLWSLFSMNLTVIGLLAWWKCDLDPSSVTSILMSIGLTVDFTAHVGYHFARCKGRTRSEKLKETLIVAGWPLIQGALSTLLAIFALVFVKSYVVQVFFRTVLLVITSGLLHALLFLPVLFLCTVRDEKKIQ